MKKEMLINVLQPEECRIAIVEDGVLEELYVERTSHESYTGNIYKGKIVNLEPAIQAAFVDFSVGRNGFLHVSDVEPQYYRRAEDEGEPAAPREKPRRDRERGEDRPPRAPREPRDRERPDRSEKGRRDRSERRFGEGLVEAWETPPPAPPKPAPAPPTSHFAPASFAPSESAVEAPAPAAEDAPAAAPARSADPDFDALVGWERPARRGRTREAAPPPPEPTSRIERAAPSLEEDSPEADLPPSRTQRSRPERQAVEPEPEDEIPSFRPRRGAATTARTEEPEDEIPSFRSRAVEREPEPEPEPEFRRPRGRGWGRGAAAEPAAPSRIEREPDHDRHPDHPHEPAIDEDEAPRRRGRDAIRARGGDRPAERPRPRREAERPRDVYSDEPDEIEVDEPPPARPAAPERTREPEARPRGRGRGRSAETPAERPTPHSRAGEPGYVPRSKRAGDPLDPIAPAARRDIDDDLLDDLDTEAEGESESGDIADRAGDGPKRRRRRRGRRRDRPDREPEAKVKPDRDDEEDDLDELDDDAPAPPSRRSASPRREPASSFRRDEDDDRVHERSSRRDDFDFGDEDELDDEDDDTVARAGRELLAVDPDDEIDPELEDEIRREIDEIAELELEMGLRATTEARPRRGEPAGRAARGGRSLTKPPLQEIFRRGDEVLVQVIKESIGTKGPTLSTYISIPGRYLVLMPGLARVGVSRKIADEGQRRRLREIMTALNPPKGLGFIVRTAGLDRTKKELARDLAYLLRLWKVILRRIKKAKSPAPIYQESDMITRTIRDIFNAEIDTIWIDEPAAFERAQEFMKVVMPKFAGRLKLHDDKVPLFHKYGLEEEIVKIQRRRVEMPEGGSIVIDQTEALVAIDVNSGNFRVENDAERTAYEMNLRAAKEIARQLRLRDLGGVICNDFIDMREEKNRRGVEKALRDAIKRDRARTKVLRMSQFGVIEMTRQRIRPSLKRSVYEDCPECSGAGTVKTVESMSIDVMRLLALAANRMDIRRVNISVAADVATYLNNRKRKEIAKFEGEGDIMIYIHPEHDAPREHLQVDCFDAQNGEVRLLPAPPPPPRRGR